MPRSGRQNRGHRQGLAATLEPDFAPLQVDFQLGLRVGFNRRRELRQIVPFAADRGNPVRDAVAKENLGERFPHNRLDAPANQCLRRVFTRRATAKIPARHQHRGTGEAGLVEGMVGHLVAIVFEHVLTQPIKGHAPQVAGGNDAVGIDVVEQQGNPTTGDDRDLLRHVDET